MVQPMVTPKREQPILVARGALRAEGYDVATLTNAQLQSPTEFQAIIVPASRKAGKRTRYLSECDMPRHRALRSQIARYHARGF